MSGLAGPILCRLLLLSLSHLLLCQLSIFLPVLLSWAVVFSHIMLLQLLPPFGHVGSAPTRQQTTPGRLGAQASRWFTGRPCASLSSSLSFHFGAAVLLALVTSLRFCPPSVFASTPPAKSQPRPCWKKHTCPERRPACLAASVFSVAEK